jgi:predicted dehydrogenase
MKNNESDSVKVGVIGVGVLGRHHARLYCECRGATLVGVYDSNADVAKSVAAEFGTQAFDDIDELAAQVDGLSVAVPTDLHFDIVRRLLENDVHVLVEKPITDRVADAEELVRLASGKNLVLQVGHVERYNPVLECLDAVPGEVRFIEAHRLAGYPPPRPGMHPRGTEVSVVLDLMIHDIDVVLSLVRSPVKRVDAVGVPILSATEDIANARLVFENGCVANITASRVSAEPMRRIRVFKTDAYLCLDFQEHTGEMAFRDGGEIARKPVPVRSANALQDELQDFVDCIYEVQVDEAHSQPRVTGRQGLEALRLAHEIMAEAARVLCIALETGDIDK